MLKQAYESAIQTFDIEDDIHQRQILDRMIHLEEQLLMPGKTFFWRRKPVVKGLYIYGPVGVGKTFLMDLFFENIAIPQKSRYHFHHFMQQMDAELRRLQGRKNPLHLIANELARTTSLLCFDEFLVHDVAEAMILGELLKALLEKNIILIATSNTSPDNLYLNGVHRDRFLPTIAMIKAHCDVLTLQSARDYRLGRALDFKTWFWPQNPENARLMAEQFNHPKEKIEGPGVITVQNRAIPFLKRRERAIWFDFKVICNSPRSQLDYLEISNRFDTVFLDNLPLLKEKDTLYVILLIHMVDVFYDRGIQLIVSAEGPLEALYTEGEMLEEFQRTFSRLKEMQSRDYHRRHPRRFL